MGHLQVLFHQRVFCFFLLFVKALILHLPKIFCCSAFVLSSMFHKLIGFVFPSVACFVMDIQFSWLKSEMFSVMSCEAVLTGLPGIGKFFISSPTEHSDDHVSNAERSGDLGLGLGIFHICILKSFHMDWNMMG